MAAPECAHNADSAAVQTLSLEAELTFVKSNKKERKGIIRLAACVSVPGSASRGLRERHASSDRVLPESAVCTSHVFAQTRTLTASHGMVHMYMVHAGGQAQSIIREIPFIDSLKPSSL